MDSVLRSRSNSLRKGPLLSALVVGTDKVIVDHRRGSAQYFNLALDPLEREPAAAASKSVGRRLVSLLEQRKAKAAARGNVSSRPLGELDPALDSALRSLGYLE